MRTVLKTYAQFQYAVEMSSTVAIPLEIKTWLVTKDHPFDISHIIYTVASEHKRVLAFEYSEDAYYFIAWMEQLGADTLDIVKKED
jgi:phage-related protein